LGGLLVAGVGTWLWLHWLEQSYDQPYSLIENGLFLGSAVEHPPPGTAAVVNLCGHKDPYEVEACLWAPIYAGGEEPSIEWLQRVVEFISTQRRADRSTYVHCLAGMNRSAAAVTAYLMREHSWSRDEALAYVRSKRPQIQPNPEMLRLLQAWERRSNQGNEK